MWLCLYGLCCGEGAGPQRAQCSHPGQCCLRGFPALTNRWLGGSGGVGGGEGGGVGVGGGGGVVGVGVSGRAYASGH